MDWGGLGELIGVALLGASGLVGWRFGAKAERSYNRVLGVAMLVSLAGCVLLVGLVLLWSAITD